MNPRLVVSAVLTLALATVGCSRDVGEKPGNEIRTVADLKGRHCGIVTGTAMQDVVDAVQKGVIYDAFNDAPSMVEALRLGKVDAVPLDTVVLRRWAANCPGEFKVVASFADNPYGYFFQKGSPLRTRVNGVLARMKVSGDLRRIVAKWCESPDLDGIAPEPYPHTKDFTGRNGTLRFATAADYEPGSFIRRGEVVGYDIDLAKWIACENDFFHIFYPLFARFLIIYV